MFKVSRLFQLSKKVFKSRQANYLVLWILSLIVFYLVLFAANFDFSSTKDANLYILIFLVDIGVGGITFLLLLASIMTKLFTKSGFFSSLAKLAMVGSITVGFFYLLINLPNTVLYQAAQEKNKANQPTATTNSLPGKTNIKPSESAVTPTSSPKVTNAKPQVTPKPSPYDGKINCGINDKCGGGSIRLTKEECEMTTCCEINSSWSFYRDKTKCSEDQKTYYTNLYKVNSYTAPTPSYPLCEVYYPSLGYSQTYNYMTTEACNTAKMNAASYSTTVINTPTPAPQIDYAYENSRCKADVRDWLQSEQTKLGNQLRALGAGDSSAYEYGMQSLQKQAEKAVKDCDYYYPIN